MSDYETRVQTFGLSTKEELAATLQMEGVTILDVRSQDEIDQSQTFQKPGIPWVHSRCTPDSCEVLSLEAEKLLPKKEVPIIVYCKSGRRASKAKEILLEKGYTHVLNAGGYDDVAAMGL